MPPARERLHRVTPLDVLALLNDRLGVGVGHVEPLEGGAWSRAFGFLHLDRPLVVRFSPVEEDFRKDARAARFAAPALPVPAVLEVGRAFGGWYAITERREGRYLEEADDAGMHAVLPSLLETLDALRTADLSGTTGFGGWSADGNGIHPTWQAALRAIGRDDASRRIHGWSRSLAMRPEAERAFATAYEALERLAPDVPDARHLVHSDLLNRNVLVAGDRISAVLDWGSALYGDFLFDLAWITVWQPWYGRWSGVDFVAAARQDHARLGLEVADFGRRLRACELYIALDGLAYQAWAGFDEALAWTSRRAAELLSRGWPGTGSGTRS